MLAESSLLETTAQVSISLAGFVGVFLVLARRDGAFSPADAFLIRVLILCCIPPVFYSVLPLLLTGFGFSAGQVWTASSSIAAIAIGFISLHVIAAQRSLHVEDRQHLPFWQSLLSYLLVTAGLLAQAANAVHWPLPASGALYASSIWLILLVGGMTFTLLILRRVL